MMAGGGRGGTVVARDHQRGIMCPRALCVAFFVHTLAGRVPEAIPATQLACSETPQAPAQIRARGCGLSHEHEQRLGILPRHAEGRDPVKIHRHGSANTIRHCPPRPSTLGGIVEGVRADDDGLPCVPNTQS